MATADRYTEHGRQLADLESLSRMILDAEQELLDYRERRRRLMVELRGCVPVEVIAVAAGVTREHAHRLMRHQTREG